MDRPSRPGIAVVLEGPDKGDDEYDEEQEFKDIAADFEAATGVTVKDPSLLVATLQRCCEFGERGYESESDDEGEYADKPRGKGKPSIADALRG